MNKKLTSMENRFPCYFAKVRKVDMEIVEFIEAHSEKDLLDYSYTLDSRTVDALAPTHFMISWNTFDRTCDGEEPEHYINLSTDQVKDLFKHSMNVYCGLSKDKHDKGREILRERLRSISILQFSKFSDNMEGYRCDLFVDNYKPADINPIEMMMNAAMRGDDPDIVMSTIKTLLEPISLTVLEGEEFYWDPIMVIEKKAEMRMNNEEDVLREVNNLLGNEI